MDGGESGSASTEGSRQRRSLLEAVRARSGGREWRRAVGMEQRSGGYGREPGKTTRRLALL
jgi:hypothetical protein